jgi:hypothetical protein
VGGWVGIDRHRQAWSLCWQGARQGLGKRCVETLLPCSVGAGPWGSTTWLCVGLSGWASRHRQSWGVGRLGVWVVGVWGSATWLCVCLSGWVDKECIDSRGV